MAQDNPNFADDWDVAEFNSPPSYNVLSLPAKEIHNLFALNDLPEEFGNNGLYYSREYVTEDDEKGVSYLKKGFNSDKAISIRAIVVSDYNNFIPISLWARANPADLMSGYKVSLSNSQLAIRQAYLKTGDAVAYAYPYTAIPGTYWRGIRLDVVTVGSDVWVQGYVAQNVDGLLSNDDGWSKFASFIDKDGVDDPVLVNDTDVTQHGQSNTLRLAPYLSGRAGFILGGDYRSKVSAVADVRILG